MRLRPRRIVISATVVLAGLAGCNECGDDRGEADPASADRERDSGPAPRLVVLGFDGADPERVERWVEDGQLPNLAAMMDAHAGRAFRRLESSNPPQSPVAWASFATGTRPGRHGVFGFVRRALVHDPDRPPVMPVPGTIEWRSGDPRPEVANRRSGEAFWKTVADRGIAVHALNVPYAFPPPPIRNGRILCGAGVPDVTGTPGTFRHVSTEPETEERSHRTNVRHIELDLDQRGRGYFMLDGPVASSGRPLTAKVHVRIRPPSRRLEQQQEDVDEVVAERRRVARAGEGPPEHGMLITAQGKELRLQPRELSPWVRLTFRRKSESAGGLVRFVPLEVGERTRLLVSPVAMDPSRPRVPISYPYGFADRLADELGGAYSTLGWAHPTAALESGVIDEAVFLAWMDGVANQREQMLMDALERDDWRLLLWFATATDRVAHMFYRLVDESHPAHDPELARRFRSAIAREYRRMDRIVGKVKERLRPRDALVVLSDHGMHSFRRGVHVNRWLADNGFLTLEGGEGASGPPTLNDVDWDNTRAYALGTGQIYLNLAGREREGTVTPGDAPSVRRAIRDKLQELRDGNSRVVRNVYIGERIFAGEHAEHAPDLQIGFAEAYRGSWATTTGGVPRGTFADNRRKWSGDHAASDVEITPGLIVSDRPLRRDLAITDLAPTVLRFFDKEPPTRYVGTSVFAESE